MTWPRPKRSCEIFGRSCLDDDVEGGMRIASRMPDKLLRRGGAEPSDSGSNRNRRRTSGSSECGRPRARTVGALSSSCSIAVFRPSE